MQRVQWQVFSQMHFFTFVNISFHSICNAFLRDSVSASSLNLPGRRVVVTHKCPEMAYCHIALTNLSQGIDLDVLILLTCCHTIFSHVC